MCPKKSLHSGKLELSHAAVAPTGLKKLIRRSCTQHVRGDIGRGHAAQVLWLFQGGVAGRVACKFEDGHLARGQEVQESTGFGITPVKKYELIMNDGHRGSRLEPLPQTRPP